MKKVLSFVACLLLASTVSAGGNIEWAGSAGVGLCLESGFDMGFGGSVFGGYKVDKNLSLGGTVGYYTFNVSGLPSGYSDNIASLEIAAALKYRIGTSKTRPFLTAAAGLSDYIETISIPGLSASGSEIYPLVSGGAGVEFEAGPNFAIFVSGKLGLVIGNGATFKYLPVEVGASF